MIIMQFLPGWNARLLPDLSNNSSNKPYHYTKEKPFFSELMLRINEKSLSINIQLVQKIIENIMRNFDTSDCLYGFFHAMSNSGVSPFIATHDYCAKVSTCDRLGNVTINISPIYHLGLDYPEDYKNKHGRALDQEAVIGLLETPVVGTLPPGHTAYSYGIDAGILFKDSKIPHNTKAELKLEEIPEGLLATLSCDKETTSKTLSWENAGVHAIHSREVREEQGTRILPRVLPSEAC